MIRYDDLMAASDKIDQAALLGIGWPEALEAMSRAAAARGVMIMHNRNRKLISFISDESIREGVEDYLAGKAPPNTRQTKVRHDDDPGFRVDYDDFEPGDIARDAYYQDYLRPLGLHWHANARLQMEGMDEIAISFKRELRHGPYDTADKLALNHLLPRLRAAAQVTECVFAAETRGIVRALHQRGRPVLEFDALGRVRRQHGVFDGSTGPLTVIGARAVAAEQLSQLELERAIDKGVRPPRRAGLVLLNDIRGRCFLLQILPVSGRARDVFLATSAVGVLIGRPRLTSAAFDLDLASELFALTVREAQIAGGLCEGQTTEQIARTLKVVPDTVRFHLKSIFEKTGSHSRVEVVALIAQLVR